MKINVLNSCLMGSDLTTHFYRKSRGKSLTGNLEDEGRTRKARDAEISSKTQYESTFPIRVLWGLT